MADRGGRKLSRNTERSDDGEDMDDMYMYEEEPDFSDPDDYVDSIDDEGIASQF